MSSAERFLGWFVDGQWAVKKGRLTFMDFKQKGFLCTNNLVLRSPTIEFSLNMTLSLDPTADRSNSTKKEVVVINFSQEMADIRDFDENLTSYWVQGISLFLFRDDNNAGTVFMKEFEQKTKFDAREVFRTDFKSDRKAFCNAEFVNKDTVFKAVLDFSKSTFSVTVDGEECLVSRIDERVFPVEKAAVSLMGFSTEQAKASLSLNHVTISKLAVPLTTDKDHFASNMYNLEAAIMEHDPDFYNNTSLSTLFLMNVT